MKIQSKRALHNIKLGALLLGLSSLSLNSHAMLVWAVLSGGESGSNTAGNALSVGAGLKTTIDLYYDVEGDTSWGYDFSLTITGEGTIDNVNVINGSDFDVGNNIPNGWRQLGGDPLKDETGSAVLAFQFDFLADPGAFIVLTGNYASGIAFDSVPLTPSTIVSTANVPLPLPGAMLLSALASLFGLRLTRRRC
ncbi:MAG: hypothetical protein V3T17_05505 [Pseudomonadales bacterium]